MNAACRFASLALLSAVFAGLGGCGSAPSRADIEERRIAAERQQRIADYQRRIGFEDAATENQAEADRLRKSAKPRPATVAAWLAQDLTYDMLMIGLEVASGALRDFTEDEPVQCGTWGGVETCPGGPKREVLKLPDERPSRDTRDPLAHGPD